MHRAAGLSLEAVLADSAMLHGLRTEALRLRIDEAAIAFLVQLAQLRAAHRDPVAARVEGQRGQPLPVRGAGRQGAGEKKKKKKKKSLVPSCPDK